MTDKRVRKRVRTPIIGACSICDVKDVRLPAHEMCGHCYRLHLKGWTRDQIAEKSINSHYKPQWLADLEFLARRDAFFKNVIPVTECGCWLWEGVFTRKGYGVGWWGGKKQGAHRISWKMHMGPIPSGMGVLHKCDVRCCVNPEHLFLGTNEANTADMVGKGRQAKGERRPEAKLTEQDILRIRESFSTMSLSMLGRIYRVHPAHISKIVTGKKWKHLPL